ncbi:MAG: GGDEF domain-containing protein [Burkholderiaceae bacterium]
MRFSLATAKNWLFTHDPSRLEPRVAAIQSNALFTGAISAVLLLATSLLGIGKMSPAVLAVGAVMCMAIIVAQAVILSRRLSGLTTDAVALRRVERRSAAATFVVHGFIAAIVASRTAPAADSQLALVLMSIAAPLLLLRPLAASPLVYAAAAAPLVVASLIGAISQIGTVSSILVAGLLVATALVIDQVLRSLTTLDQSQRARSRERSLMSQQLALFSTSQLGIAQTVNGKLGRANARFRQWFGEGTGDTLMAELASAVGMTRERLQKLIDRADKRVIGHDSRTVNLSLNGATPRYFSVQVRRFDPGNPGRGLLWTVSDQTSDWLRRQANERAAVRDPLTGALNRRALHKRISTMLARDLRRQPFAVLCVDINRFGELNKANGEGFGDQILCIVARRLQRVLREQDLIARTGGNEFVLVLDSVNNLERANQIAEKVMEALSAPIVLTSLTCTIAASVGSAVAPMHGRRPDEILGRARSSMFAIKRTLVQVQAGKLGRRSP